MYRNLLTFSVILAKLRKQFADKSANNLPSQPDICRVRDEWGGGGVLHPSTHSSSYAPAHNTLKYCGQHKIHLKNELESFITIGNKSKSFYHLRIDFPQR